MKGRIESWMVVQPQTGITTQRAMGTQRKRWLEMERSESAALCSTAWPRVCIIKYGVSTIFSAMRGINSILTWTERHVDRCSYITPTWTVYTRGLKQPVQGVTVEEGRYDMDIEWGRATTVPVREEDWLGLRGVFGGRGRGTRCAWAPPPSPELPLYC